MDWQGVCCITGENPNNEANTTGARIKGSLRINHRNKR